MAPLLRYVAVFQLIFCVARARRARLAFRRPPAKSATNTVAAQKIMATTDNIVMNSNILNASFRERFWIIPCPIQGLHFSLRVL